MLTKQPNWPAPAPAVDLAPDDPVPEPAVAARPSDLPPCIAVVGPTGSGKSELALALAERLGGEIVNADSLQVYRLLDIGTAKPSAAQRKRVPHHLLDVVNPDEPFSAGRYAALARAALRDIAARSRVPILCGGTGLYLRALTEGLTQVPPVPAAVRAAVAARVQTLGLAASHAELRRVDPQAAARIHPHDAARIARALEVFQATGQPLSRLQQGPRRQGALLWLALEWPRAALYARLDQRVRAMLGTGWAEEVRGILAQGYAPTLKPLRAIGYQELVEWALGQPPGSTVPETAGLADSIALRTRHYAKRQLTWFRARPGIHWLPPEEALAQALPLAEEYLQAPSGLGKAG